MKLDLAASLAGAALLHALVLFGFRFGPSASPLPVSADASPVDVSLVDAAPAPSAAAPPAAPEPTPEALPPEPEPVPDAATPPPDMATPPPMLSLEQNAMPAPYSIPVPKHAPPHPARHPKSSIPHAAPGGAAGLAGAGSHGAPGTGPGTLAHYLSDPKPDYPELARQMRQQGVVELSVVVDAAGSVAEVSISRSSGYPMLDQAAVQAVRRWRFEPARAGGLPVPSKVQVPVRFSLAD